MCGIFGILNQKVDEAKIRQALFHRGPDGFGYKQFDKWCFYHTRLSILDLSSAGSQPMTFAGNVLCFNGEIYNYQELQKEYLPDENIYSTSDTEVLLHLLCRYGMKVLNKLNGMFAFAFYEAKTGNTYLVRDRYGVKPLYYYRCGEKFAFSSQESALVLGLDIPYEFDKDYQKRLIEQAISDNDEKSPIKDIFQVKAGHYLTITPHLQIKDSQWYFFNDSHLCKENYQSKAEILDQFETLLIDSIRLRNRADVKVGITLSGGLDSSLIYTLAKEKLNAKYTIFTYANANKELDESCKVLRLAHTYADEVITIMPKEDTINVFKESLYHLNAPIWAPSHTGYFNVYKAIKENHIKVVLEGHGADELLGGWPWTLTSAVKQALQEGHFRLAWDVFSIQQETWNKGLSQNSKGGFGRFLKQCLKISSKHKDCFSKLLDDLFTTRILPINLRCWDRLSMANSVESRAPFLDYRVVEFLKYLPLPYKVNKIGNKAILREILLKYHKNEIVENKVKQGYLSAEVNFLNRHHQWLLTYYPQKEYHFDISAWETGSLDYSYDTTVYRVIAYQLLKEMYSLKEPLSE